MSTQALSDRCRELGLRLPRPVLSNLENGRRESVSISELLVLAAALDVPPILLMIPLGLQARVEILPDLEAPAWDAARWILGRCQPLVSDGKLTFHEREATTAIDYFRAHDAEIAAWRQLTANMRSAAASSDDSGVQVYRVAAERTAADLMRVRATMLSKGLVLPPLPSDVAIPDASENE